LLLFVSTNFQYGITIQKNKIKVKRREERGSVNYFEEAGLGLNMIIFFSVPLGSTSQQRIQAFVPTLAHSC